MVRRTVYQAHSRQNSSVLDVTQAVSRRFYVMDMKQRAGFFFHDSPFFFIPFGNTAVVILLVYFISDSFCMSEG